MTRGFKLIACILCAIAVHGVIFVATDAGLRAANAAIKALGPGDVGSVVWSHRYYSDYASEALAGKVPYRDFAFEYPVLSYPLFLIPRLLVSDFESYRYAFMAEMFLFDVAAIVLIARHGGPGGEDGCPAAGLVHALLLPAGSAGDRPVRAGADGAGLRGRAMVVFRPGDPGRDYGGPGHAHEGFSGVVAAPALVWEACALGPRGPGGWRLSGDPGGRPGLLVLLGGRRCGIAGLPCRTRPGDRVTLRRSIVPRRDDLGSKASWVFDHNAYHLSSEWGARLALFAFPVQATASSWSCGLPAIGDGRRPAVLGSRGARLHRLRQSVVAPVLDLVVPVRGSSGRPTGSVARKIFLLACVTTALFYPGPGFAMVLEHQPGRSCSSTSGTHF